MTTSPAPRRWIAFLAATAVVATAAFMGWRRLAGGEDVSSKGAPVVPAVPPPTLPPPAVHVTAGDEIFAVDLGIVTGVDFEKGGQSVTVRRKPGPGGGFTIAVGPIAPRSCVGGAALEDLLPRLTAIKVTRVVGEEESAALRQQFGGEAATLRIRDNTALDPKEFRILFPDDPPPRALLLDGPALYETSIPRELFDRLSAGCAALGRR